MSRAKRNGRGDAVVWIVRVRVRESRRERRCILVSLDRGRGDRMDV